MRTRILATAILLVTALEAQTDSPAVISFTPSLEAASADRILLDLGIVRIDHPDLLPFERLARISAAQREQLTHHPEITRIYSASAELESGMPVHACAGPVIAPGNSKSRSAISTLEPWSPNAAGIVELTWSLTAVPEYLPYDAAAASIERALAEWSRHAPLTFKRTSSTRARRSLDFLFGAGDHGDPYPFQGRNGVLAHGFYPAGVNPEPIAGDIHLNADETWSTDGGRDVFSVTLHEIGHALGLSHSDTPGSVMYPYFSGLLTLQPDDVAALTSLYGTPVPVPNAPLSLTINGPRWLSDGAVELSGTVSGGSGSVIVYWSSDQSGGSTELRTWTVRIASGAAGPSVSVTATDSTGAKVTKVVSLFQEQANSPPPAPAPVPSGPDKQPPTVRITSPASAVIATSAARIRIAGSARDSGGVEGVSWATGSSSGTATGTSSWVAEVDLITGDNYVVIEARDLSGNTGRATVLITRR